MEARKSQRQAIPSPLRPQAPEPLHCAQCLAELPPEGVITMEVEDYVQYYCGLGCLEAWQARQGG